MDWPTRIVLAIYAVLGVLALVGIGYVIFNTPLIAFLAFSAAAFWIVIVFLICFGISWARHT